MSHYSDKPAEELSRVERVVRYEDHRRRYLPLAIDNAKRKLAALEVEAKRLGMEHVL